MLDRRDFLKSAGLLTLGATMMPEVAMAKKPKKAKPGKKQIGFQAYSLGPELAGDNTAAGLKRLHDMGYTYVELAGFEGHSASELQKMAADAGIKVVSTHLNPNTNGEKYSSSNKQMIVDFWKKQIDEHAPFGMQYIVQPGLPRIDTIDDAKRVADVFNAAGEVAKKAGLKWGYHNHNREFNKVKGGVNGQLEKFENTLNRITESIAVLIVTSCAIPIAVLIFFLWLVKLLTGVSIQIPQVKLSEKLWKKKL